ncbi:SpoIIE family protein phosphatase [Streptomyces fodineus]
MSAMESPLSETPADEDTAAPQNGATEAQEAESEGNAPEFTTVAVPEIVVRWNQELAPTLRDGIVEHGSLDRAELLDELPALWATVDAALARVGPGTLVTESVRHDSYEGWQVAALPRYDLDGGIEPRDRRDGAPQPRDRRALVQALVDAVAERPCLDLRDALNMLDVFAGIFPSGLDAICRRLLGHDLRHGLAAGMAPLHDALERRAAGCVSATCYRETAVGSRKAKGDPATDNEDAAGALRGPSGTVRCAVFDGVTGDGDGSGGKASRAALEQATRRWLMDEDLPPGELVAELDAAVGRATEGSAAAVLATVRPDGTASVVSVGDAEAWLVRPLRTSQRGDEPHRPVQGTEPPYAAWKLTPAHTGYAELLRVNPDAEGEGSSLVNFLGGGPGRWTHSTIALAPGDLLLLASDGATQPERERWFGAVLAELAAKLDASGRPPAPALAAALVQRAEALGGWDNATALVCAIGEAKDV